MKLKDKYNLTYILNNIFQLLHTILSDILKKLINKIMFILMFLEDGKIKTWWISNFIRNHTLILSIPIIIFGIYFIYEIYDDGVDVNQIAMYPEKASYGIIFENGTYSNFNPLVSKIPIHPITINIRYKKPVLRQGQFEVKKIEMTVVDNNYDNIDNIELKLRGAEGSIIYSLKQNDPIPIVFRFNKNMSDHFDFQFNKNMSEYFDFHKGTYQDYVSKNFSIISKSYSDYSLTFIEPSLNDNFNFDYELSYDDFVSDRNIKIIGKAEFFHPIRCANDVEMANIKNNKIILLLTGVLIILGTFPFLSALKQLLEIRP